MHNFLENENNGVEDLAAERALLQLIQERFNPDFRNLGIRQLFKFTIS